MWSNVNGEWKVLKMYKGVSWENIDFSYEHKTACPVCRSQGNDESGDNLHIFGEDENGLPRGAFCFSDGTTIISVAVALEDEQNKSSLSGKVISSMLSSKRNKDESSNIKQENSVAFGTNSAFSTNSGKLSRDQQKLAEKRLTQEQIDRIHSETSDELKVNFRGLDKDVCKELNVRWSYCPASGKVSEMLVPAYVVEDGEPVLTGYKVRKVRDRDGKPTKDFYMKGYVGRNNILFGEGKAIADTLIICEGEIDLISVKQMLAPLEAKYKRNINVVSSMLGASSTVDALKNSIDFVNKHKKIILCLDSDDAGKEATKKCLDFLPKDKLFTANLRYKDPNDYLKNKSEEFLATDVYWNCSPAEEDSIKGSGILLEAMVAAADEGGVELPFFMNDLKPYLPYFPYDSITLVCGSTSIGKTTLLREIILNTVMTTKEMVAVISMEASEQKFAQNLGSRILGVHLNKLSAEEQKKVILENHDKLTEVLYNEDGSSRFLFHDGDFEDINEAIKVINRMVKVKNVRCVILDPIQNLIGNLSNEDQRAFMLFCEKLKKSHNVLFLFGTHFRKVSQMNKSGSDGAVLKEDDVEGSGSITKSASTIIILSRNKNSEDPVEKNTTYISLPKNREFSDTGELLAKAYYRASCSRLYPFSFAEQHNFFQDDKFGDIIPEDIGWGVGDDFNMDELVDNAEIGNFTEVEIEEELPF